MWSSWAPSEAVPIDRPFDYCGYNRNTHEEVFRFRIEPRAGLAASKSASTSKTAPLPQTVAAKGLRATLAEVRDRREPVPHCRALINAMDSKKSTLTPIWVAVEDGQGRHATSIGDSFGGEGFAFDGLCRREPAWKFTATFVREPEPGAVPDQVWDYPSVSFGGKQATAKLGDRSLQLECLTERAAPGSKARRVIVRVRGKGFTKSCRISVLRINGLDAREVVRSAIAMGPLPRQPVLQTPLTPATAWNSRLSFPLPTLSSSISLRLGEYGGREVEFAAAPPQVAH